MSEAGKDGRPLLYPTVRLDTHWSAVLSRRVLCHIYGHSMQYSRRGVGTLKGGHHVSKAVETRKAREAVPTQNYILRASTSIYASTYINRRIQQLWM